MKKTLNIGLIGVGRRGKSLLENVILHMDDINVLAVCDLYEDRVNEAANLILKEKGTY